MAFIKRQRSQTAMASSELGCWVSANSAAHDTGYVKINMRNTTKPGSSDRFRVQPWGHQVGAVAGGQGHLLRLTTDGSFAVCLPKSSLVTLDFSDLTDKLDRCHTCATTRVVSTPSTWWWRSNGLTASATLATSRSFYGCRTGRSLTPVRTGDRGGVCTVSYQGGRSSLPGLAAGWI
jgi:hypothetical protein